MDELREFCEEEYLDFKISLVNAGHKVYFGSLNGNYQYIPPKTPIDYLFQGVNRRDINRCIQYFRTQPLSFQDEIGLVGFCRSLICHYANWEKLLNLVHCENIPKYINDFYDKERRETIKYEFHPIRNKYREYVFLKGK